MLTKEPVESKRPPGRRETIAVDRVSGLLHDLNNLFLIIRGNCDLMRTQPLSPPDTVPLVEQIRHASLQAGRLLRYLEGSTLGTAEVLDAGDALRSCLPVLRALLGSRHRLEADLDVEEFPLHLRPGDLERILANLVVNAREAMVQPGTLTLRACCRSDAADKEFLELTVADSGPGIPPAIQARLFQPGNSSRSPQRGKGLALVRELVEDAGGTIEVDTGRQGTTFHLRFPSATAHHQGTNVMAPSTTTAAALDSRTVLLVEDEPLVRNIFTRILRGSGYFVIEAATPTEALILAEHFTLPIHLLLADLSLPRMNGVELAGRLQSLHPETRVLLLSGYGGGIIPGQMENPPPYPFLQKPCTSEALVRKIREVLGPADDAALKDTVHDGTP